LITIHQKLFDQIFFNADVIFDETFF